ncbi:MAG: sugar transporter ATPase [Modestobacter sp.]|nr:sugar transporter ATPase [Modestobacter sp.]
MTSRLDAGVASSATAQQPPVLEVKGLRKVFGGNVALAAAELVVQKGEIHGLLGENGAGKSTLIRCLARIFSPDGGEILVNGEHVSATTGHALQFIHQETGLIEELSVAENIALSTGYARRFGLIEWAAVRREAVAALDLMGVRLDPDTLVAELPQATRTVVAIARAVARRASLVVLDEPTATLSAHEVQALFRILRQLREAGVAIVFVTHRLDEVFALCDRVTVLRDGATQATADTAVLTHDDLVRLITGSNPESTTHTEPDPGTSRRDHLVGQDVKSAFVGPVSFRVAAGEIVGFTGLTDGGHYELGAALFGLQPIEAGTVTLRGTTLAPANPRQAIGCGVGYVPSDRAGAGLAADMSVAENLFLNPAPDHDIYGLGRLLSRRRERGAAAEILRSFGVRPEQPDLLISALSGGNAQKVLVARWLRNPPPLMILNDLTFGVDVGARAQLYELVRRAVALGSTAIIVTSDFEEIEALCHRAYVLTRGLLAGELAGPQLDVAALTRLSLGRKAG